MKKNIKIAAVVTFYNPSSDDIANIQSYLSDINKLYIIDNTEENNNENRLPKSKKINYLWKNENLGVAKAFNIGAQKALEEGYEWLLTMDQDSKFNQNVIQELKKQIEENDTTKIGIVCPWLNTKLKEIRPKEKIDYPHDVMSSGNLINLKIWKELEGFKEWLFIDGIDMEYCLNLAKNGYKIMRINTVEMIHELGDIEYKTFMKRLFLCTHHNYVRRYYIMRNYHYIFDLYHEFDPIYCNAMINQRHNMIGVLLFEKDKYRKLRNYKRGLRDYKQGIKGKYRFND